jgi:hypothetical protein
MTDATGPQETQAVAGLSDDDAKARPAGNRRPKPVIVEKKEAADGLDVTAAEYEASVAEGSAASAEERAATEAQPEAGEDGEPVGADPVVGEPTNLGDENVDESSDAPSVEPEDVRTDYLDPEFATPKEISTMACNLGTQIYLSRWQKKQDTPIRAGVEDAAKMITFAFDHELIMETFDRATEAANANRNFLETSRRRMKAHMDAAAEQQQGGEQ